MSRAGETWADLFAATPIAALAEAFGLTLDEEHEDKSLVLALDDLGAALAPIVAEPAYRLCRDKAERDAGLGRDTMHMAQQWRHPIAGEEKGKPALMLPVQWREDRFGCAHAATLSRYRLGNEDFAQSICDVLALPLDGGIPLSLNGYSVLLGHLRPDAQKRLKLFRMGLSFVQAWLAAVRAYVNENVGPAAGRLGHLPWEQPDVASVDFNRPLPRPEDIGTLMLQPGALEWRVAAWDCDIPESTETIIAADSRALAEQIGAAVAAKIKTRKAPAVLGPARRRAAA